MLSSTIRLLMRSGTLLRPMITTIRPLSIKPSLINFNEKHRRVLINEIPRRWSHVHYTYPMIESRVMLVLRLFDKIDGDSLKLDSKFVQDLGLDSLDIVEITAALEDDFWTEIPDVDSDHFVTPRHIIQYLCDKYDVYEHIEPISAGKEYLEEAKAAAEKAHH
jgi:NADH dehydrogenase (ubiquinone) 1 alpha/beta subcomplex 1